MGQWIAVVVTVLAVGGQAWNVFLNLKLTAALMASEKNVLEQVARDYQRKDVAEVELIAARETLCSGCPLRRQMAG